MNQNYKEGDYIPSKGYFHICKYPNCVDPYFYGRKNQKYHPDCKKRNDAEKAALKREKTKEENEKMAKNLFILEELYPRSGGTFEIQISEFRIRGFDFQAPSRHVKTEINGYSCFIIHGYAYRYIKERETIIIYKKDELCRV